jgi:oligosaccharide repeat unit polymerase
MLSTINLNLIKVDVGLSAYLIYIYVLICGALSCYLSYRFYKKINIKLIYSKKIINIFDIFLFYIATIIGSYGLFKYIYDFSNLLGGLANFISIFFLEPLTIRDLASDETSIGFQLSYFSWISIFYSLCFILSDNYKYEKYKYILMGLIFFETFANIMFIDRTRPIFIFLTSALILILLKARKIKKLSRYLFFIAVAPILIFFIQALFSGKFDQDEGLLKNFLIYFYGGMGYFSQVLDQVNPDYEFTRSFYPVAKLLVFFGLDINVPSQILTFRNIPFTTNVGTFLEPLFSDGGILFVLMGVPFIILIFDFIAYHAIKSRSVFGLFYWSVLIFISVFAFFASKFNSTYFYLFSLIYFIIIFLQINFIKFKRSNFVIASV